jgi:hypothetical protein
MAMHNESNNFVKLACGRLASVFAAVGKRLVAWPAEPEHAPVSATAALGVLGGRPFARAGVLKDWLTFCCRPISFGFYR